jgi:K+-transporting ATPase ATPase A chain
MLGTNGGGFFNANSAHPFENPTALTDFVQMLSIFLIGMGLTYTFGKAVGNTRQGWAILAAMMVMFLIGTTVAYWQESAGTPMLHGMGIVGGNMEGKEVRFGIAASALFSVVTTAASCGAVNAMHDSFTALGGMVPIFNMQLGEVVVGGVGAGIYGFLLFAILAVFVAGLMVGRTPEYVGKKIESREVKLSVLAIAVLPLVILGFTALASVLPAGLAGPLNKGPHGFSEILYAFTSAVANNGSAFAGLTANTPFYNGLLGVAMWIGRFFIIIPMLAVAGSLAAKNTHLKARAASPPRGSCGPACWWASSSLLAA